MSRDYRACITDGIRRRYRVIYDMISDIVASHADVYVIYNKYRIWLSMLSMPAVGYKHAFDEIDILIA